MTARTTRCPCGGPADYYTTGGSVCERCHKIETWYSRTCHRIQHMAPSDQREVREPAAYQYKRQFSAAFSKWCRRRGLKE